MANPTYIGKVAKKPRDRAEWMTLRGDRPARVRAVDERVAELKAAGCKVRAHFGSDEATLSIWEPR